MCVAHKWRFAIVFAALSLLAGHSVTHAVAAVYLPAQQLQADVIKSFIANPSALLTEYPEGGARMIVQVRDLAASDPATLNPIISLLANANYNQATSIGTGLGQAALMAVKTDQAYASEIQTALASATTNPGGSNGRPLNDKGVGSSQAGIGNAVTTKDQVEGVTDKGTQSVSPGSAVYTNELVRTGTSGKAEFLFADRTNLTLAPVTEIRLDKFVYDPAAGSGSVVLAANSGSFRFITGVQSHQSYQIKTPFATMGVRGTEFIVQITPDGMKIQLISGGLDVVTISGQSVAMTEPYTVLTIDAHGSPQGPSNAPQPLVNFADLGPPVTNITVADALAAFAAVTGDVGTGSTGGGGGGDGGGGGPTGTAGGIGGFFGGSTETLPSFVVTTPSNFFTLNFSDTGASPASNTQTVTVTPGGSVSPSR